jgi:hypothetical protein
VANRKRSAAARAHDREVGERVKDLVRSQKERVELCTTLQAQGEKGFSDRRDLDRKLAGALPFSVEQLRAIGKVYGVDPVALFTGQSTHPCVRGFSRLLKTRSEAIAENEAGGFPGPVVLADLMKQADQLASTIATLETAVQLPPSARRAATWCKRLRDDLRKTMLAPESSGPVADPNADAESGNEEGET